MFIKKLMEINCNVGYVMKKLLIVMKKITNFISFTSVKLFLKQQYLINATLRADLFSIIASKTS